MDAKRIKNVNTCKQVIWEGNEKAIISKWKPYLDKYDGCVRHFTPLMSDCVPKLQKACDSSDTRVVKTVRATMDEVEPLLQSDPNFRLLHLYRDPRAVYRSRRQSAWTRGEFEKTSSVWNSALVYCQTVLHDYKKRKELEKKYPGKILGFVYEHVMEHPEEFKDYVYDFLDLPENVRHANSSLAPKESLKWHAELKPDLVKNIEKVCQEFADTLGVKW